ncbi:Phytanoyl-CoA dioxygenase domain-containing protein 1, partial [Neolecta irregularis DAH-3]
AQFERDGYLIIPDFLGPKIVSLLYGRVEQLLDGFSLNSHPMTRFSTDDSRHIGDDAKLNLSGDKIHYFLEEDAVDSNGNLVKPTKQAVNKIGHALHELDPIFREVSINDSTRNIAKGLGFKDPRMLQSMIICKQPEIGGAVPAHQDSSFLYTDPPSAIGLWFALEDCTKKNGCLSFVPGSHKTTPITKRFVRQPDGLKGTAFIPIAEAKMEPKPEDFVMGECSAGTLILIHGNILHKSGRNTSTKSRYAYTFHMIEGEAKYDHRNWLQTPGKPFTKLYV